MTKLSDAAAEGSAAKRNASEMKTVSDVSVPAWKKAPSGAGKLGQKKKS